jgi:DNA-binding IclR family transcriptional regulator
VEEDSYRQSRPCRLLGSPIAFAVVELLANNNELNPSEISRAVGRSVQRVSTVLGALRLAEVVRYDSAHHRSDLHETGKRGENAPDLLRVFEPIAVTLSARAAASRCFISTFPEFRKRGSLA